MNIFVRQLQPADLARYAAVSIAFRVESILRVEERDGGLGGLALIEERLATPYVKDYDALAGEAHPTQWATAFDLSNWAFFLASDGVRPLAGAALAFDTPGVNLLDGRGDLAVLWDLRVQPECRGQGLGHRLFGHCAEWARTRSCTQLKVETQNVNVPACRFYARQGCRLGSIHRYAYAHTPAVAHEAMLLWYLDLA